MLDTLATAPLSADRPATRLATRLLFLVAGFGYACWAPLVPFTKARLGIDEHVLGLLLLCIGCGSIAAMVATGILTTRFGSKPVLIGCGFGFAAALAVVPLAGTIVALGLALVAFGATLGALDVAMNLHAVEVERAAQQPLMSGFHALFSIGGFAGSAFMTLLLSQGVAPVPGTLVCSSLMVLVMCVAAPRLLHSGARRDGPLFALPHGLVLVLAILACITFLVEGALLDWGALLITEGGLVAVAQGGIGYMLFSVAMTAGRLSGDAVAARFGDRRTLLCGGIVALAGFGVLLTASVAAVALSGFVLIGLGCANIVPVLFRRAAAQHAMPAALAVASITTTAYAGILAGPAVIGFIAKAVGLHTAFWMLAGLLALIPLCAHLITPARNR
jgi:predicted MFS family arabinose efflux permease